MNCPICNAKLTTLEFREFGTLLETYTDCGNCNYAYGYSYGLYTITVVEEHISFTDYTDKLEKEIDKLIEKEKALRV